MSEPAAAVAPVSAAPEAAPSAPAQSSDALPTLEQIIQQVSSQQSAQEAPAEAPVEGAEAPAEPVAAEPEAKPVEEKKDPMASRFAALSRKEREIRQKEQETEARMKDFESKFKELQEREAKWNNVKKAPLKTLKELGISFNDLTQDAIGEYKEPEVDPTTKRFNEFEERLSKVDKLEEALNKKFSDLDAKEANIALQEINRNIQATASDEKYELIQTVGAEALTLVKDVMSEYFAQHQRVLDYPEACDIVEKYYEDYFSKVSNTRKIKSRFETKPVVQTPGQPKPAAPKQATKEVKEPISTLTHSQAAAAQASVDLDKLPKHEALQYLARQLKFHD
jgi:hypothetical protein